MAAVINKTIHDYDLRENPIGADEILLSVLINGSRRYFRARIDSLVPTGAAPDIAGGVIDLPSGNSFGSFNPELEEAPTADQVTLSLLVPDGGAALAVALYGEPTATSIGYVLTPGMTNSANYKLGWRVRAPL